MAGKLYRRTLVAWALGLLGPTLGVVLLVVWAMTVQCERVETDCSWGLEVLIVIPVYVLSSLTIAPLAVYAALRRARDPLAASTARWALVLLLPAYVMVVLGAISVLLLPPLGGRYLALRRASTGASPA